VPSISVKFADLNMSSPEGRQLSTAALLGQPRKSAHPWTAGIWRIRALMDACVHKAIADAVTTVNQPALFVVYNEHNKTPLPTTLLSQSR
jgi:hypothetical protein